MLVLFAAVLYWLGVYLKDVLYQDSLEVAKRSHLAAVYAVQASMVSSKGHQKWDQVVRRIPRQQDTEIEIMNIGGKVLFSTEPSRLGTKRHLSDAACKTCHKGGSSLAGTDTAIIRDPDKESYHVFVAPLRNTSECKTCHNKQGPKLGIVLIRQRLSAVHRQIRTVQIALAIAGVIVFLLTILATHAVLSRYLSRPLRKLVAGAKVLGAGKLDHVIDLPEHGELDILADTLNASAGKLDVLQKNRLAEERLATIGETVTGLAHCLKNTLNGLRAGQFVIERAMKNKDEEKLHKGWRVMKNSAQQVERLTFDMLYYAKARVPERSLCDVNDTVREVAEVMKEVAAPRSVEIRLELSEAVRQEALDRTSIYRAVLNLVTNAVDACDESEKGDLIIVSTDSSADDVIISVVDNGVGMPAMVRDNLFMRFFSTKESRGTGLGLPVVKKIAEEHGGSIEVESCPGEGSTFRIRIPRASTAKI